MIRAILFMVVCLVMASGIVTFFFELPKFTAGDKKVVMRVILILAVSAALFLSFAYMLTLDNHHSGVLP